MSVLADKVYVPGVTEALTSVSLCWAGKVGLKEPPSIVQRVCGVLGEMVSVAWASCVTGGGGLRTK